MTAGSEEEVADRRFWLIVHEPGKVPDLKGPWASTGLTSIIREFIAAYPTAYLTVLTVDERGAPDVQHGPAALQMADARSMSTGRKHNARTKEAHSAALADQRDERAGESALRKALEPLARAEIDVSGTAAIGITAADIIRAQDLLAARASPAAPECRVPDGWALVPVDPTEAMLEALHSKIRIMVNGATRQVMIVNERDVWAALLAARPLSGEG